MFENLLESKAKRQRSFGQTVLSLAVHGALIFLAVKATQGVAETIKDKPVDTTMVFLKPPPPPPPPPEQPPPEQVVTVNPPPKGFQTVVPPTEIPKVIPPVDLKQKAFDPKDFTGKGIEGGIATGVAGGTGPVDVKAEVFTEAQLDDPAQPISQPLPRYPPVLQSAGVAGRVVVQYIVDTTGHAEPPSFKVVSSTNKAFEEPAKEAIMKSVFKPARFHGRPVRQLVQQAMSFKVGQ
ncbi:MAG TPA: TonB family protein [Gemmatimonadales bacterium]|nr:TonB family protein [Gemmatimonadales bacterium]